ncbi:hypothetical protein DQ04_14661020 [Trypanosoma grayi]|uniref:hypothetical protein n=1 Tax=Trypanosoma grayi TaxID=71804 RepID=UPI0004F46EEB|nr:hypothetical protein DQ04_14661020 [Trypanosoma grayi]KEG06316.1 hypothetical protein DQ04_14661020 [Trypanosoma grayi]
MPIVRASRWDHVTLPYVPQRPCLIYYVIPGDNVPRVAVPNARGEYLHLIPGMPYVEEEAEDGEEAVPLLEYAPPPLLADAATQVEWEDLPVPPLSHLQRFEGSTRMLQE